WRLGEHFLEPGISAESLTYRPEMMRLLEWARERKITVAVAMEETRFSRGDMCDWGYIMSVCDATGLKLATPSGIFYDPRDPNTRMMVWLKGGMSEAEKLRFMDRVRGGKKTCIALGYLPHGCAPFGYRAVRYGPKPAHKRLEVVDEEARIVRL